jgi:hypothetical protein
MRPCGTCPTRLTSIMPRSGVAARHHQRRSHQPDGRQPMTRYFSVRLIKLPLPARLGRRPQPVRSKLETCTTERGCHASRHRARPGRWRRRAHAIRHPAPHAAENDVIVRVCAAGFTPGELDWPGTWTDRAGRDWTPSVPGHDLSGVVSELGYGTTGLTVGQRVFGLADWTRDGSLAEYTAVEARNLAPLPAGIDHTVAAAVPISGLTAWQGLFGHAGLKTGQTVLIHGAAGRCRVDRGATGARAGRPGDRHRSRRGPGGRPRPGPARLPDRNRSGGRRPCGQSQGAQ